MFPFIYLIQGERGLHMGINRKRKELLGVTWKASDQMSVVDFPRVIGMIQSQVKAKV